MQEDYYRSKEFTVISDLHKVIIWVLMNWVLVLILYITSFLSLAKVKTSGEQWPDYIW